MRRSSLRSRAGNRPCLPSPPAAITTEQRRFVPRQSPSGRASKKFRPDISPGRP
ncbi:hypothetical protein KCP69_12595 [Salmonella enterica subsp. enterica]|nr:hypothetical protein KCP69_12595 [Salmonella enterica subsp. enterica]